MGGSLYARLYRLELDYDPRPCECGVVRARPERRLALLGCAENLSALSGPATLNCHAP